MSRERGAGSGTARCASSRRAAYASHVVRQRLATIRGATRTPTTRVGQPSTVTARARPAAVPPVPSGRTIASGGEASCPASSNPASRWPTTARGCAPPPAIQRRGPSAPARCHASSTASGREALACRARAALIVHARARASLPLAVLDAWHRAGALGPRRWIAGGGAHPRAVVGHLLAGLELAGQLASPPDAIVLPLGTGGTAAGLALAVTVLGWPTRVVGVRVAPRIVANRWRTTWLAYAARRLLAHRAVPLPAPRSLDIVDGLGEGYGHPTPEGEAAERLASEHGLTLDPTYGAKAFAVLLQRGTCNVQRVVFWHTFAVPVPQLECAP